MKKGGEKWSGVSKKPEASDRNKIDQKRSASTEFQNYLNFYLSCVIISRTSKKVSSGVSVLDFFFESQSEPDRNWTGAREVPATTGGLF